MGLFNFIYKLTNILSNKRKIKVFVIIAIIILLLFCWSRGSFAATSSIDDLTLINYQIILQESLVNYLRLMNQQKLSGFDQSAFNLLCGRLRDFQVYVTVPVGDNNSQFWVYFYAKTANNNPNIFQTEGTWSIGLNSGTQIPCMLGQITPYAYASIVAIGGNRTTPIITNTDQSFYMPAPMFEVRSTYINEFLEDMGLYSSLKSTYSTHDSELQSAVSSGFNREVNAINQVDQTLNDVNSSVEDVNQSVMQMIEEITAPYVNVNQEQLPTQEVNDTTQDPLNTLFDYIKDAFTGEPTGFSLPLPFVRW